MEAAALALYNAINFEAGKLTSEAEANAYANNAGIKPRIADPATLATSSLWPHAFKNASAREYSPAVKITATAVKITTARCVACPTRA